MRVTTMNIIISVSSASTSGTAGSASSAYSSEKKDQDSSDSTIENSLKVNLCIFVIFLDLFF